MDTTTLYELEEVGRRYGQGATEVRALAGVNLRIAPGEFIVVAGPSGSGKTTLFAAARRARPLDGRRRPCSRAATWAPWATASWRSCASTSGASCSSSST